MKNKSEIYENLRRWIAEKSEKVRPEDISDQTPIIEQRVIKSLQIPDLILFIEEETGRSIDVEQLKPGVFRNIETIYRNFFLPVEEHGSGPQEA